jgi:hypothetical protein
MGDEEGGKNDAVSGARWRLGDIVVKRLRLLSDNGEGLENERR